MSPPLDVLSKAVKILGVLGGSGEQAAVALALGLSKELLPPEGNAREAGFEGAEQLYTHALLPGEVPDLGVAQRGVVLRAR